MGRTSRLAARKVNQVAASNAGSDHDSDMVLSEVINRSLVKDSDMDSNFEDNGTTFVAGSKSKSRSKPKKSKKTEPTKIRKLKIKRPSLTGLALEGVVKLHV
jgi:hypothetical protein